jgi:hypothetical protein
MRGRVLIVVVLVGLSGCDNSQDEVPPETILRAASTTADAGGARLAATGVVPLGTGGKAYRYTAAGRMDARGSTDVEYTYTRLGGKRLDKRDARVRNIVVGEISYFTYPLGGEGTGAKWYSIDPNKGEPEFYWSELMARYATDRGALRRLLATEEMSDIGTEDVRGISTKHYEARVALRRLPSLAPPNELALARRSFVRAIRMGGTGELRVELWVDQHNLVRRMRQRLSLRVRGGKDPPFDETTEYFDFGQQPRVEPPPDRETDELIPDSG